MPDKKYLFMPIFVVVTVVGLFFTAFAVGELLGLTLRVVLDDGQAFEGLVVKESDVAITLSLDHQEVTLQRNEIKSMRLIQSNTTVARPNASGSSGDEARRTAMRRVSTWKLFKDGIALGGSLLNLGYVQGRARTDPITLLVWYGGLAIGNFVVDLVLKPSVEEQIFWRSQLPFWHGLNGLIGGMASLGGAVSLALGVTQDNVPIPELGAANEWFDRAALFYTVEAGTHSVNMVYDLTTLLVPYPVY